MTIGRTDDPENPLEPVALEVARLFGTGSRTPSGPAVIAPRRKKRLHMICSRTAVKILFEALEPTGPFSNRVPSVNSLLLALKRFGRNFRQPTQVRAETSQTTGHNGASTACQPPLAADRRGQAPKPQSGASQTPGLRSTISSGTMRTAVLADKRHLAMTERQLLTFTSVATPGSRFSPRSGSSRRNIWSEAQALPCPQRAHTQYVRPNGHPRSLPAPSPRWATHHPRLRNGANVSLQDKVREFAGPPRSGAHWLC
jgi:hypothetical protein